MSFGARYDNLNTKQKEAASSLDGPCIVLAGPGTGKTETISVRIAKILEETQASPQNILCLTFTDSACTAMRKRLISIIGEEAYHVRIHTFHSFCNAVILENPEVFGFTSNLSPMDELDKILILQEILDQFKLGGPITPFGDPYAFLRDLENSISKLKQENISPERFTEITSNYQEFLNKNKTTFENLISIHGRNLTLEQVNDFYEKIRKESPFADSVRSFFSELEEAIGTDQKSGKHLTKFKNKVKNFYEKASKNVLRNLELAKVFALYQEKIRKESLYDFDDMILFVLEKFKNKDELLAKYQEVFYYILVDEFQDSSGSQNEILKLLGSFFEDPNIVVVGDDDQSIYRFQGANLENILQFSESFKKTKVISLSQNYRSGQKILDASESLIQKNKERISSVFKVEKKLKSSLEKSNEKIKIYELADPKAEKKFVVKKISELIETGVSLNEIAILYRKNKDADDFAEILNKEGIAFKMKRKKNILENKEIEKIIDFLSLIADFSRKDLLFHILHFDCFDFDPLEIHQFFSENAKVSQSNQLKLLEKLLENEKMKELAEKIFKLKKLSLNETLPNFFEVLVREIFLGNVLKNEDKTKNLNALVGFFDYLKEFSRKFPEKDLPEFLKRITLLKENGIPINEEDLWTDKSAVNLLTAHSSKGLEFQYVFIVKADSKNWGKKRTVSKIELPPGILKHASKLETMNKSIEDERRLFYVAMTRAKKECFITWSSLSESGRENLPCMFSSEITDEHKVTEKVELEEIDLEETLKLPFKKDQNKFDLNLDVIKPKLKNYVLSVTHLNNFLICPIKFYYEVLLRVPYAPSKFLSFGNAIHEAFLEFFTRFKKSQKLPPSSFLTESFSKALKRQTLSTEEFKEIEKYGLSNLENYFSNYQETFSPNCLNEFNFRSHGVNLGGIPITGVIDKIEFLDKERVRVSDYKTGNPDNKSSYFKPGGDYHRQISFYKILSSNSPRFSWKMVSGEIDFIVASRKTGKFIRREVDLKEEDVENTKQEIKFMWEKISNFEFNKTEDLKNCENCSFGRICQNA